MFFRRCPDSMAWNDQQGVIKFQWMFALFSAKHFKGSTDKSRSFSIICYTNNNKVSREFCSLTPRLIKPNAHLITIIFHSWIGYNSEPFIFRSSFVPGVKQHIKSPSRSITQNLTNLCFMSQNLSEAHISWLWCLLACCFFVSNQKLNVREKRRKKSGFDGKEMKTTKVTHIEWNISSQENVKFENESYQSYNILIESTEKINFRLK